MPDYTYVAVTAGGERQTGVHKADTPAAVKQMLAEKGLLPIKIEEVAVGQDLSQLGKKKVVKIKKAELSIFCRQLCSMLTSGIPIANCLEILAMQAEKKTMRDIIWELHGSVQQGESLSESLKKQNGAFPDLMINLIEAGEVSGKLDVVVDSLANQYEKDVKINKKIAGSMIYPCVLAGLSIVVVIFMLVCILPTFISMYDDPANLPGPTKAVMKISDSMTTYWYIYIGVVAAVIFAAIKFKNSEVGKKFIDTTSLKMPVAAKIIEKVITARFTRTISTVLASGVPLISALEIVSRVTGNSVVTKLLLDATDDVKRGDGLADAIKRTNFFPPMVNSMLRIGEESGDLDDIMSKTADFYEDEVDNALSSISTILEPIMLVFMAGGIGFIVVAMIMPMFGMIENMNV